MSESRVEYLQYAVEGSHDYTRAEPIDTEFGRFRIAGDGRTIRLYPLDEFSTLKDARAAAEPIVRSWEGCAVMNQGEDSFRLRFTGGSMAPSKARSGGKGPQLSNVLIGEFTTLSEVVTFQHNRLPELPKGVSFDGTAGLALNRLERAMRGHAFWTEAGYYVYTAAILGRQSRNDAAAALGISGNTLKKLKAITGRKGGPLEGRKASSKEPLSDSERQWVERTSRDIVMRLARLEGGSNPNGDGWLIRMRPKSDD